MSSAPPTPCRDVFQWDHTTPCEAITFDGITIHAKLEYLNPSGSTKDRIARCMLDGAIADGLLPENGLVVEASSGSTAIALAMTCAKLGLRFVAVMPKGVSQERILMIQTYGAEVELTPAEQGVGGAMKEAERIAAERDAFLPRQFENPDNAHAHACTTAREMLEQIPGGRVDAVVSGVGTGGTLVGLARGCAKGGHDVIPVLAKPLATTDGTLCVQCFGEAECPGFSTRIPGVVDGMSAIFQRDDWPSLREIGVKDIDAIERARALIRMGHPVGPSSGLNVEAALRVARDLPEGSVVATVLCDRMERYLSTGLFDACVS